MARRVGIDRNTGKIITGWQHCAQSIGVLVTTAFRERIQRRDIGSFIPGLIDKPQNEEHVLKFFMAVAVSLEARQMAHSIYGEPDFKLIAIGLDVSTPGTLAASVTGYFYEEGRQVGDRRNLRVAMPVT